jgi:DNA-binding NarL/FixJ family response regulator
MQTPAPGASLHDGTRALERGEWQTAREAFEAVLRDGESALATEGLGMALWFLGDVADGIACRERAFEEHLRAGSCDDAVRIAVWVAHQHFIAGRPSAARGWLARSERALGELDDCPGRGWVAVERARHATSVEVQSAHARRAMEIARDTGEHDLEVVALSLLGRAEVTAGRLEEGMGLLEEAMATAAAGRARNLHTIGEAYCNLVDACAEIGDWDRAHEWCEVVSAYADRYAAAPLIASCRTIHAEVLLARGRWPEAEHHLEGALETHAGHIPELGAPTVGSLAELRIRQGRLAEAEELLAGSAEHPLALRALALLRIAEDRPRAAVSLLERGLRGTEGNAARGTQLLAPLVDGRLACGDVEGARTAAEQLAALALSSGIRLVDARAQLAAARVALAAGRPADAAEAARRALSAFGLLAMPYDAAEARLELARAAAAEAPELAADEARAALLAFRELGASRAMDAASALLRDLGSGGGGRAPTGGELTAREQEVLELLALGMSNARIARTLVISEKTAGHHVSRILAKLGVTNRTEAARHATGGRIS